MIEQIILLSLVLIALIVGTVTDIKTREVPDWVNYSLIFSALGIRLIYSTLTFEWMFFVYGLFGLGIAVAIGYMMFYAGQWGGGDAKLLMGVGALIGFVPMLQPFPLLLVFLINVIIVGSIYGLIYSIILAVINMKAFKINFKKIMHDEKLIKIRKISSISLIIVTILFFILLKDMMLTGLVFIILLIAYLSIYLVIFIKAVEIVAMYKFVEPEAITEGDWIAKDYNIDGKYICGPKDLGIDRKQIKLLIELKKKGRINKIKVKYGIPFVPSFLIAFILSMMLGAWWIVFV